MGGKAPLTRAKYQTACTSVPLNCSSERSAFPLRLFACCWAIARFAGAEAPKTAEQVAKYGGVEGEQLDPCYHEDCDTYSTVTGQPPASTMNVYEQDPTPANLVTAQQQADSLNGNALRSLEEFKGTLVHAVWYFARTKNAFP